MKHTLLLTLALAASLILSGCGRETKPVTYVETELPEWVVNPYMDDNIGGQGSALPSRGGFNETLAEAEGKARTELARSLDTKVRSSLTHFFSEGGQIYGERQEDPRKNELWEHAERIYENLGRQITNVALRMTHRKAIWTHPETKEMFVWVAVDDKHKEDVIDQAQEMAKNEVRRAKIAAELKADAALERLDREIDRRMRGDDIPRIQSAQRQPNDEHPLKN